MTTPVKSLIIGLGVTMVITLAELPVVVPDLVTTILTPFFYLGLPGLLVRFLLTRNVHDDKMLISVILANWAFYTLIVYLWLRLRKRQRQSRKDAGSTRSAAQPR